MITPLGFEDDYEEDNNESNLWDMPDNDSSDGNSSIELFEIKEIDKGNQKEKKQKKLFDWNKKEKPNKSIQPLNGEDSLSNLITNPNTKSTNQGQEIHVTNHSCVQDKNKNSDEKNEIKFLCNKRKRNDSNTTHKKLGRKKDVDKINGITGKHTNLSNNNIIAKYQVIDIEKRREFINKYMGKDEQILKINFKQFASNMNVTDNLGLDKKPLYEIFSSDISNNNYKIIERNGGKKDYNKKILELYKNDESSIKGKVLHMTYDDYTNISLHRNIGEMRRKYGDEIINNVIPVEEVLDIICNKAYKEKKKLGECFNIDAYLQKFEEVIYKKHKIFENIHPRVKRSKT